MKFMALLMSGALMLGSCGMSNTAKGGLIGGGSGAAVGAAVGLLVSGKSDKAKGLLSVLL